MSTESTRPLLLPQNRRLRHLKGIYLRNLTFSRPRGRTIDDSAIHKPPTKLASLNSISSPQLQHAASSESLRQLRRRSTNASSSTYSSNTTAHQQRFQKSIDNRTADVFFTIHGTQGDEPLYISETIQRANNFNFQFFDFSQHAPAISRCTYLLVKVWARHHDNWSLLLEEDFNLSNLRFLGPIQSHHFPPNCLLFHLVDGVYSLDFSSKTYPPKHSTPLFTSSYNALMKLSTLDNSIQDALATRDALAEKITTLLDTNPPLSRVPLQQSLADEATRAASTQRRTLKQAQSKRDQLRASITARRKAIQDGTHLQHLAERDVTTAASKLPSSYALVNQTRILIHGQRRRLCEDLTNIFPITPLPNGPPLSFQILGMCLPNTEYDPSSTSAGEQTLSAALGYVAFLVHVLQFYLCVPVPYGISPFGSRSSIRDDISMLPEPQRDYPLYLRGGASAHARLDYGWFLLNKNIEALCGALGLRVVDIRHTLPNMKYLLYVGSAGSEELPERKRGGVRGLLMGRVRQRLDGRGSDGTNGSSVGGDRGTSRRGSGGSEFCVRQREEIQRAIRDSNVGLGVGVGGGGGGGGGNGWGLELAGNGIGNGMGNGKGVRISGLKGVVNWKENDSAVVVDDDSVGGRTLGGGLPVDEIGGPSPMASPIEGPVVRLFDETQKLTLRTKGMRERATAPY